MFAAARKGADVDRLLVIRSYPTGPRVWIVGQRVHHGATGAVLLAAARRRPWLAFAGLALCAHDRRDWRAWFAREALPLDTSSISPFN